METEPAGAFPHCCFDHLFPLGCQRKSEKARKASVSDAGKSQIFENLVLQ